MVCLFALVQKHLEWRTDFLVQHYGEGDFKNESRYNACTMFLSFSDISLLNYQVKMGKQCNHNNYNFLKCNWCINCCSLD